MAAVVPVTKETIEKSKEILDLAAKISEHVDPDDVSKILDQVKSVALFFGVAGVFLNVAISATGNKADDKKHKAIMDGIGEIKKKLTNVSTDIKDLEKEMKWSTTKIQYSKSISTIEEGITSLNDLYTQKDTPFYKKHFIKYCGDKKLFGALQTLIKGFLGNDEFSLSILDATYDVTHGDLPKISEVGGRMTHLIIGGMSALLVLVTFENDNNFEKAKEFVGHKFNELLSKMASIFEKVKKKCKANFKTNIEYDIHKYMDKKITRNLYSELKRKYCWLDIMCITYEDYYRPDMYCAFYEGSGGYLFKEQQDDNTGVFVMCRDKKRPVKTTGEHKKKMDKILLDHQLRGPGHITHPPDLMAEIKPLFHSAGISCVGIVILAPTQGSGGFFSSAETDTKVSMKFDSPQCKSLMKLQFYKIAVMFD